MSIEPSAAPVFEPMHCMDWEAYRSTLGRAHGGILFVQVEAKPSDRFSISVCNDGLSAGFTLTVDEARALAAEIVKACDAADAAIPTEGEAA